MELTDLAKAVCQIARNAGDEIMRIYENEKSFQIEHKEDQSPLTIADRNANKIICDQLMQLDILHPIISEETKTVPFVERKTFSRYWLVDPLDGTKEFIKRNDEFTVNIALIDENEAIMGVVYAPALKEMYWAVKGHGAHFEKESQAQQLRAAHFSMEDEGLKVVCSRSHLNEATQTFIKKLKLPSKVATGSSLKFLILAKAEAHVYPRLGPTMEWDTAAAQVVLEEAGGKVISEETGEPLRYNKENLLNPYFTAYGQVQH